MNAEGHSHNHQLASALAPGALEELQLLRTDLIGQTTEAEIWRFIVGPIDNNVFVIRCRQTGDAILIDAANEHDRLLRVAEILGVRRVIETHGHWDHIAAIPAARDAGLDVAITEADADMIGGAGSYDSVLLDESVIEFGKLRLSTIATPGHTPGSMCFKLDDTPLLFTGDTLFPGGPGATHFPGGDFPTIMNSIEKRIVEKFDPETIVLPGHGGFSTLADESPWLENWAARGY